jgi:hypothetical protein
VPATGNPASPPLLGERARIPCSYWVRSDSWRNPTVPGDIPESTRLAGFEPATFRSGVSATCRSVPHLQGLRTFMVLVCRPQNRPLSALTGSRVSTVAPNAARDRGDVPDVEIAPNSWPLALAAGASAALRQERQDRSCTQAGRRRCGAGVTPRQFQPVRTRRTLQPVAYAGARRWSGHCPASVRQ